MGTVSRLTDGPRFAGPRARAEVPELWKPEAQEDRQTPLHIAADLGFIDIVQPLVQAQADPGLSARTLGQRKGTLEVAAQ